LLRRAAPAPAALRQSSARELALFDEIGTAPPAPAASVATPKEPAPAAERSQWDRIALTDDIELHVRRPLSRQDHRRVERLITIARQVLGEEKP
jgi:hypothetical protein